MSSLCIGGLKGNVLVISGQVNGKTLLPMTPQAEQATQVVSLEEGCVHIYHISKLINTCNVCVCICVL